jgi:hypothetical protein
MSTQLPDKLTPLNADTAAKALASAYKKVTGRAASKKILSLLVSQSSLETGNWQWIHNYNFGNDKWDGREEFFQVYSVGDDPTDPGAKYTAHKTAEDGAIRYINVLKRRPHWWEGLQSADPKTFIKKLSTPPVYFTADPTRYYNSLMKEIEENAKIVAKYSAKAWPYLLTAAIAGVGSFFAAKKYRT